MEEVNEKKMNKAFICASVEMILEGEIDVDEVVISDIESMWEDVEIVYKEEPQKLEELKKKLYL